MVRNLKRMFRDERGMMTLEMYLTACIVEIASCISPPSWLCCVPCIVAVAGLLYFPFALILDIMFCPVEALLLPCLPFMLPPEIFNITFGKIFSKILGG
jgi:hypothetical protein